MTAEIAILNKSAIALAADSAVTIASQEEQKIYNTINKVFMLSKYHPVGIMIYGNADFMGTPWESIIKIYRDNLGKIKFDSLNEYCENFINFLSNNNPLFPETEQEKYFLNLIYSYLIYIKNDIDNAVRETITNDKKIKKSQITEIIDENIKKYHKEMAQYLPLPHIQQDSASLITKYDKVIIKATEDVFQKLPVSKEGLAQLKEICISLFIKDKFPLNTSGIVITGFGEKETFPTLISLSVDGIFDNTLKYKQNKNKSVQINGDNTAAVIPFAQSEVVESFMEGMDPLLYDIMDGYLSEIFDKYPDTIIDEMKKISEKDKKELKGKLKEASKAVYETFLQMLDEYKRNNHIDPVIAAVSFLPKAELAAMAESLVSLTIFQRKISIDVEETAGGPIDVAVISKGDGFVWIKRKHYFKPELNPFFLKSYYRED